MLARLLRQFVGPKHNGASTVQAQPAASDTLYLDDMPGLRNILPPLAGTYAALVNSQQGLVIINRHDAGVGWQLSTRGAYDAGQMQVLRILAEAAPAEAVALDIGANIGITSLILARAIGTRGMIHAFEPQRVIFHMLAGNMALNGIDNVHCHHQAVGRSQGDAQIPRLNYREFASFGSIELNRATQSDAQQQAIDGKFDTVAQVSVDSLALQRVDLVKIDVEGMEEDVLAGAAATIARHQPLMYVEYLKSGKQALGRILADAGYMLLDAGDNFVCIPRDDPRLVSLTAGLQMQAWLPD